MNAPAHKTEITAALGHELRGPLCAISAAAEVLKRLSARMEFKDPKDAALMAHAQAVIARQSGQLAGVIDDMLCGDARPGSPR